MADNNATGGFSEFCGGQFWVRLFFLQFHVNVVIEALLRSCGSWIHEITNSFPYG